MGNKKKRIKHPSNINIKLPTNILGKMKIKPTNIKKIPEGEKTICEVYDCDIHELIRLLADIATGLWRIKNKFSTVTIDDLSDEIKKAYRHVESTCDALKSSNVEVRGHSNERYVAGMSLKVIAFQPTSSINTERIIDTIKPSVFYKDKLIQKGEVIVATPDTTEHKKNNNDKRNEDNKERSGE